jgi:heme/copper-type cytochrome/quinol oxidase subunit 2
MDCEISPVDVRSGEVLVKLIVLGVCGLIAVLVFLTILITVALHRTRRPWAAGTTVVVECLWAAIPCLIVIAAALPAVRLVVAAR